MANPDFFAKALIAAVLAAVVFFYYAQKKDWLKGNFFVQISVAVVIFFIAVTSIAAMTFFVEIITWLAVLGILVAMMVFVSILHPKDAWQALDQKANIIRGSLIVKLGIAVIIIYAVGAAAGQMFLEQADKPVQLFREGSVLANSAQAVSNTDFLATLMIMAIGGLVFVLLVKKIL